MRNWIRRTASGLLLVTMPAMTFNTAYFTAGVTWAANPYNVEVEELSNTLANDLWEDASTDGDSEVSIGSGSTAISGDLSDIFPGMQDEGATPDGSPSLGQMADTYDDGEAMDELGTAARTNMYEDSQLDNSIKRDPSTITDPSQLPWSDESLEQAGSSTYGVAYDVMRDSAERPKVDLSDDPIFAGVRQVVDEQGLFQENFFDCSEENSLVDSSRTAHIPDYKTCDRIKTGSNNCEIKHDYTAAVVQHYAGPFNLRTCQDGQDCQEMWIGKVGNNYWSGKCKIYEQFTQVKVVNPDAIVRAEIEYAKWDDHMQIYVGPPGQEEKVWQGPNANQFPPETAGKCELSTSWKWDNLGVDVTQYFKQNPDDILSFKIRVSVSGEGEGYARLKIYYDPEKVIKDDTWTPQDCISTAQAIDDGFANGTYTCTNQPTASGGDGCVDIEGLTICSDDLKDAPIKGVQNTCRTVQVDADFDFYKGNMECWTDPEGNEHCPTIEEDFTSQCEELEAQGCGFISQECVGNAEGESGTCYVTEEKWDCGRDVEIPSTGVETTYQCDGDFQCIGTDCFDNTNVENADFAKVAAMLNMAQSAQQDMECTGVEDAQDNVSCKVFGGSAYECKTALGGIQDCCEQPVNVSAKDYLTMIMAVPKIDEAITSARFASESFGSTFQSGYNTLRSPIADSVKAVTEPLTSMYDNTVGAVKEVVTEALDSLIEKLKEQTQKVISEIIGNMAGPDAAAAGGQAAAGQAGESAATEGATMMGAASTLMAIYGYYALAMAIIKIVWACEEDEFMLAAHREYGNCTYVGSYCKTEVLGACIEKRKGYCCFKSPMARIMQEQIRQQMGDEYPDLQDFGDAEDPQCGGIPLDVLNAVDWDKVNLDEWTATLVENDLYQGAPDNLTVEALTGEGNWLGAGDEGEESRPDVIERTSERMGDLEFDERYQEAREIYNVETK